LTHDATQRQLLVGTQLQPEVHRTLHLCHCLGRHFVGLQASYPQPGFATMCMWRKVNKSDMLYLCAWALRLESRRTTRSIIEVRSWRLQNAPLVGSTWAKKTCSSTILTSRYNSLSIVDMACRAKWRNLTCFMMSKAQIHRLPITRRKDKVGGQLHWRCFPESIIDGSEQGPRVWTPPLHRVGWARILTLDVTGWNPYPISGRKFRNS